MSTTCLYPTEAEWNICVNNLTIIGSENGLSPGRRQAIISTNDGILTEIDTFSFKKMHLKMSSGNLWPFCLGLNELIVSVCSSASIEILHTKKGQFRVTLSLASPSGQQARHQLRHLSRIFLFPCMSARLQSFILSDLYKYNYICDIKMCFLFQNIFQRFIYMKQFILNYSTTIGPMPIK